MELCMVWYSNIGVISLQYSTFEPQDHEKKDDKNLGHEFRKPQYYIL